MVDIVGSQRRVSPTADYGTDDDGGREEIAGHGPRVTVFVIEPCDFTFNQLTGDEPDVYIPMALKVVVAHCH